MLSNKKTDEPVKKGKGYKDAQWEAEVRKSLATKKQASSGTLSKQDQALVQAQLEKEAVIRKRVEGLKSRLERGLALVRSLVKSNAEELKTHVSSLVSVLLSGAFGNAAVSLVGENSFKTYLVCNLSFSSAASSYLFSFRISRHAARIASALSANGSVSRLCEA